MKMLVVYQSKTGFTKKYAQWIAQELSCELKSAKEVTQQDITSQDLIIYGGWIMGNMISHLEAIRKMPLKKLVTFGVGFSKKGECEAAIIETNKLADIPFFYMEGGLNPKEMGFFSKFIVKMVTKKPVTFSDNTDKKYAMELVSYVRAL